MSSRPFYTSSSNDHLLSYMVLLFHINAPCIRCDLNSDPDLHFTVAQFISTECTKCTAFFGMATGSTLLFEGCNYLRQRLVLATVSGKSVKIKKIRHKDNNPGLRDFEASLIRLFDKITNGSTIEVNETEFIVGTGLGYV